MKLSIKINKIVTRKIKIFKSKGQENNGILFNVLLDLIIKTAGLKNVFDKKDCSCH